MYRGGSSSSILLATKPPGTRAGGASLSIPSRRLAILSFLFIPKSFGTAPSKYFFNSETLGRAARSLASVSETLLTKVVLLPKEKSL